LRASECKVYARSIKTQEGTKGSQVMPSQIPITVSHPTTAETTLYAPEIFETIESIGNPETSFYVFSTNPPFAKLVA